MAKVPKPNPLVHARDHLGAYAAALWPPFELPPHLRLLAEHLEAVERGEIDRLMVFMPPRHGKSVLASTLYPAWYLGRHALTPSDSLVSDEIPMISVTRRKL
jgi:hypothetical protein